MKVYIDSEGRILAVNEYDGDDLKEVELSGEDEEFFNGWSDAKIMCYRLERIGDNIIQKTAYVPSNLIDKIAQMQTSIKALKESQVNQDELLVELLMGSMGDDDLLDIALDDDTTIEEE